MNRHRGFLRDLLLVSISTSIVLLVMHFSGLGSGASQIQPESTVVGIEQTTLTDEESVNSQLTALKLEMAKAHVLLNNKIEKLGVSERDGLDDTNSIESYVERLSEQPTFQDKLTEIEDTQEYDQKASNELMRKIDAHLAELAMSGSSVGIVDCYTNKCVMEFEHDSLVEENVFKEEVLFDGKGPFTKRFTFTSASNTNGKVSTRIIVDR